MKMEHKMKQKQQQPYSIFWGVQDKVCPKCDWTDNLTEFDRFDPCRGCGFDQYKIRKAIAGLAASIYEAIILLTSSIFITSVMIACGLGLLWLAGQGILGLFGSVLLFGVCLGTTVYLIREK